MSTKSARWALGLGTAIALAGCAGAEQKPAAEGQSYTGWYMEQAGQGVFQLCGQSQQWRVSESAELRAKAREFGLDQDSPVYVRLVGVQSANGNELKVSRVDQFGSPTPVRNCGMTGVVIPAPSPPGN